MSNAINGEHFLRNFALIIYESVTSELMTKGDNMCDMLSHINVWNDPSNHVEHLNYGN